MSRPAMTIIALLALSVFFFAWALSVGKECQTGLAYIRGLAVATVFWMLVLRSKEE